MIKWYMNMTVPTRNDLSNTEQRIAHWLVVHRFHLLFLLAALCLAAAPGLTRLDFNSELSVLLPESDPLVAENRKLQERFNDDEVVSFALAPHNGDVFSTTSLEALAELQRRFREIPGARRIDSLLNHQTPYGEVSLVPWPWQNLDRFTADERANMRQQALAAPLARNRLINGESSITFATVTMAPERTDGVASSERNRTLSAAVLALLRDLENHHPSVAIEASAEALFEQDTRQAMINDLTRLLPLTIVVCVLFIAWCFRSVRSAIAILSVALVTVYLTLAGLGLSGRDFNTVSIMAPLVVVIIAVADAVHLVSIHRQRLATDSPLASLRWSLAFNLRPVTLATLTTITGFASLALVSAPALSDFGTTVATGVGFAWLTTFLLLPALIPALHQYDPATSGPMNARGALHSLLGRSRRLADRHDRLVYRGGLIATLVCLALLPLNTTDFDRMDFVSEDSVVHDYYQLVGRHMDRGPVLTYGIMTPDSEYITDPGLLRALDRFADTLRGWPEVTGVASLVELVRGVNAALPDAGSARDGQGRIPDSEEAVRQHLSDYRAAQNDSYPLSDFVDASQRFTRFFVSTRQLSNQELVRLDSQLHELFARSVAGAELLPGSGTLLFARMDDTVTGELLRGYWLSLIVITLTLIVGLRSVTLGLASLLPNVMPAIIVFGIRGLFDAQIDPFILMLFSVSVGLVVDDTVHILSTCQRSIRAGQNRRQAMDTAVFRAGPALVITTLVLCLGSLILLGASTLYFQQAARLLVPIVGLALLLDLTFLPTLLRRLKWPGE